MEIPCQVRVKVLNDKARLDERFRTQSHYSRFSPELRLCPLQDWWRNAEAETPAATESEQPQMTTVTESKPQKLRRRETANTETWRARRVNKPHLTERASPTGNPTPTGPAGGQPQPPPCRRDSRHCSLHPRLLGQLQTNGLRPSLCRLPLDKCSRLRVASTQNNWYVDTG